jgi:hypothetical protein
MNAAAAQSKDARTIFQRKWSFRWEVNRVRKRMDSLPYAGPNRFRFEGFYLSLSAPPANLHGTLAVKRNKIKARFVSKARVSGILGLVLYCERSGLGTRGWPGGKHLNFRPSIRQM